MKAAIKFFLAMVRKMQLRFLGFVFKGFGLEKDCPLGMVESRRWRGRRIMKYMDNIKVKEIVGRYRIYEEVERARNKGLYHSIVPKIKYTEHCG